MLGIATQPEYWRHLEIHRFGPGYIVRSKLCGAIVQIESPVADVVARLISGENLNDLAVEVSAELQTTPREFCDVFGQIVGQWQTAGLFDGPHLHSCPGDDLQDTPETRVGLLQNNDRALLLLCEDPVLAGQLRFVFGRFMTSEPPHSAPQVLSVAGGGEAYCVRLDGTPLWEPCDLTEARSFCTRTIAESLTAGLSGASLHAGAVAGASGAVAFTGISRSGKSTLTGNLVTEGYRFVSDDILPVGLNGDCVYSIPVPLALKEGGGRLPALEAIYQQLVSQQSPRDGVRYADLSPRDTRIEAFPLRALVLPSYLPDSEDRFYRLDPMETLRDLVMAGAHFPSGSIASLLKLMDTVPIYRLIFRSTQFALDRGKALLEEDPESIVCNPT